MNTLIFNFRNKKSGKFHVRIRYQVKVKNILRGHLEVELFQSTRPTLLKRRDVLVQKNGSDKICMISRDQSDDDLEFDLEIDLWHKSQSNIFKM